MSNMGSKKKSKAKQAKIRASQIKLANKEASKKAQRRKKNRKLKSRLHKVETRPDKNLPPTPKPIKAVLDNDEVLPLEDQDVSFYSTPGQNVSFASTVMDSILSSKSEAKSKKRKKRPDESDTEDYERFPRKLFSTTDNEKKMMLPIKTKNGIIQERFIEASENAESDIKQEEEVSHDQPEDQSDAESLPELSPLELYTHRQEKLRKRKERIAELCSSIMENPNENIDRLKELLEITEETDPDVYVTVRKLGMISLLEIGRLKDLLEITEETDPDVYVTVRKLGMISLLEVFKDIIPGYPIRSLTDKEQQQRMKKETIALTDFESGLLKNYGSYLQFLQKTTKGHIQGNTEFKVPAKAQKGLTEVAVKCFCDLVTEHPHFNYRQDIFGVIVNFMDNKDEQLSDMSCECVKKLFKGDKAGNVTLELTRVIGKMIKSKDFRVQPKVLDTFLSLRIKEVSYTDPIAKKEEEKRKANLERMSRKDKKRRKYMVLLEKDMKETVATEDRRKRLKLHTETIQAVFLTYFRILKKAPESDLLPSVLEGLAKFAHLISVDFFNDLFSVLSELIEAQTLSYRESLHCVQTAFTILTGQGSVLNIDPIIFYRHFYNSLYHIHSGTTSNDVPIVLHSLDVMISQRKRQVSQQRVLAFIKRLSSIALQQLPAGSVGILSALRTFFNTYRYSDVLLDNETSGSGMYLPELTDPEHCNAHNTALWELTMLQHHYDPMVRKFAVHLCKGAPSQGEGQLSMDLRKLPITMYEMMEQKQIFNKNLPERCKRSKHKHRRLDFLQQDFKSEVQILLEETTDWLEEGLNT